jgi:phytoene desaturase
MLVPVGNLAHGSTDWPSIRQTYRAQALGMLARLGVPDVERRIRFEKIVTPVEWAADLNVHHGATFNLAHSINQMLYFRPHNRFEDLDGLYLVGGGTHPGSGLPVIFEGARITSTLLAEDLGLPAAGAIAGIAAPPPPAADSPALAAA